MIPDQEYTDCSDQCQKVCSEYCQTNGCDLDLCYNNCFDPSNSRKLNNAKDGNIGSILIYTFKHESHKSKDHKYSDSIFKCHDVSTVVHQEDYGAVYWYNERTRTLDLCYDTCHIGQVCAAKIECFRDEEFIITRGDSPKDDHGECVHYDGTSHDGFTLRSIWKKVKRFLGSGEL